MIINIAKFRWSADDYKNTQECKKIVVVTDEEYKNHDGNI